MTRKGRGKSNELALRERLERLSDWRELGPVTVEHNNEAKYVLAVDGSRWVKKDVAVTGPNQLPVPAAAFGGSGDTLAWFSRCAPFVSHYSPARLPMTSQQSDFGRIVALDVWIINEDRHPGNILLVSGDTSLTPSFIDFGSAMVGHPSDYVQRIKLDTFRGRPTSRREPSRLSCCGPVPRTRSMRSTCWKRQTYEASSPNPVHLQRSTRMPPVWRMPFWLGGQRFAS